MSDDRQIFADEDEDEAEDDGEASTEK